MDIYYPIELIASFLAVVIVLTLHEFSHAFVAVKCGDPTPKWNKRLSLNPLRHFDILGLICFTLAGFGWAKPVPINSNNFKNYRRGLGLTASAGIIMNFICAILFYPFTQIVLYYAQPVMPHLLYYFFLCLTSFLYSYSLAFCVFNLIPLNPLDGWRIVEANNKRRGKIFQFFKQNGQFILLGLIVESFICQWFVKLGVWQMAWFDILGWILKFATGIVGWPIEKLWGLIPW